MKLETILKLALLVLALLFGSVMAWVGAGFAGATLWSLAMHSLLVLVPLAGIVLVIRANQKSGSGR